MHGLVLCSLRNYIIQTSGEKIWLEICSEAKIDHPNYPPIKFYPDEEVMKICQLASQKNHLSIPEFLENFGKFLILDLINLYKNWIHPDWNCLDFLMNVQCVLHAVAKTVPVLPVDKPDPPLLTVSRENEKNIVLIYQSPRKLCALAQGLILGAGQYYKEPLNVKHPTCMLRGDKVCTFFISSAANALRPKKPEAITHF